MKDGQEQLNILRIPGFRFSVYYFFDFFFDIIHACLSFFDSPDSIKEVKLQEHLLSYLNLRVFNLTLFPGRSNCLMKNGKKCQFEQDCAVRTFD